MSPHPSPDGTAARAFRAADPTLRPNPTPTFRLRQPRSQGAAAWLHCLLTALLCVLLAACAPSGSGPSGNSGLAGDGGDAAVTAARPAPADATTTPPADPAMQRDGLPSGLPFASAGEPRVHMPAPAAPQPAPRTSEAAPAPRSLADFALMTQDGQNGPGAAAAQGGSFDIPASASDSAFANAFANAFDRPVLRILYNAGTKGTLHPCPS